MLTNCFNICWTQSMPTSWQVCLSGVSDLFQCIHSIDGLNATLPSSTHLLPCHIWHDTFRLREPSCWQSHQHACLHRLFATYDTTRSDYKNLLAGSHISVPAYTDCLPHMTLHVQITRTFLLAVTSACLLTQTVCHIWHDTFRLREPSCWQSHQRACLHRLFATYDTTRSDYKNLLADSHISVPAYTDVM